jgi:Skp family chaperone for outer membrane proteins
VAEAEGISMVVNKDAEAVLWHLPSVDITVKVIDRLTGKK